MGGTRTQPHRRRIVHISHTILLLFYPFSIYAKLRIESLDDCVGGDEAAPVCSPRGRTQYLQLEALDVQTEVVDGGLVQRNEQRVQRETRNDSRVLGLTTP